jgi:hypothetical protein
MLFLLLLPQVGIAVDGVESPDPEANVKDDQADDREDKGDSKRGLSE